MLPCRRRGLQCYHVDVAGYNVCDYNPQQLQTKLFTSMHIVNSPTLYSQITGKYASVESKIFPHILLLCPISYSCFNGLTINQHFIKPLQGEKCTSYLSVVDLSIVLHRVFFFAALCGRTNLRLRSRARTPTKLLRPMF